MKKSQFYINIEGQQIKINMEAPIDIDEFGIDEEYIASMLRKGFIEGEVCHQPSEGDDMISGWWSS